MVETMKREYLQIIGIDKGEESQFNNRPDLQENHRRKLSYIKERKKERNTRTPKYMGLTPKIKQTNNTK